MPAWIIAALMGLRTLAAPAARALAGTPARALLTGATGGALIGGGIPGVDLFPDGGGILGAPRRRRRRRRALTASDRADIAFITATLGVPSGKAFAIQLAARPL